MSQLIQAIRGMNDILPDDAELWEQFEALIRDWLRAYGYRPIRMPLVEPTPLFSRAIGEVTDIVEKEMYSFTDGLNGDSLTLRPEGTASCVRAVLEHSLLYDGPKKLWYMGPMFRHERPQKGRYRQFHQVGVEALGLAGPDIDAEQIIMCARLWDDMGLQGIKLEINSLGRPEERAMHRKELIAYLEQHRSKLDSEAQRRLHSNPLRILDSKNPELLSIIERAPTLMTFLGEASLKHYEGVQALLMNANIHARLNTRLVRGLDYYHHTVFEWVSDQLGAQGTVCAGGRYDGLVEQLGGKSAPACGFAMGVERLLALWVGQGYQREKQAPDVFLVHQGEVALTAAFKVAEELRDAGIAVQLHCGGGSFKSQMKRADASGAPLAVIIGDDEAAAGEVAIKLLRESGDQRRVGVDGLALAVSTLILGTETSDSREREQNGSV